MICENNRLCQYCKENYHVDNNGYECVSNNLIKNCLIYDSNNS